MANLNLSQVLSANLFHTYEVLNFIWMLKSRGSSVCINKIHSYFNKTASYTSSSIYILDLFAFISIHDDGSIAIADEYYKILDGSWENARLVFKSAIAKYKPLSNTAISWVHQKKDLMLLS
jgi:hypothetical protein